MMLPKPPIDREPLFQLRSFANDEEFTLHWQMTTCERFALQGLLRRLRPSLSLEVGTYLGGSLRVLSRFSEAVISVDIDPQVAIRLAGKFPNVELRSGDSARILRDVVSELNEQRRPIGFVLLDGDHRGKGVRRDIEALLELEPQQQVVFVLHDSFNPGCREGMRTANWAKSRLFDLDFIPGVYH
jgi:cephalosporin hydroxylase